MWCGACLYSGHALAQVFRRIGTPLAVLAAVLSVAPVRSTCRWFGGVSELGVVSRSEESQAHSKVSLQCLHADLLAADFLDDLLPQAS